MITPENTKLMIFNQRAITEDLHFCYESVNNSCQKIIYPKAIRILLYTFFTFIIVLTTFGNLFVIISITHFKRLHTQTNFLILSLAATDVLLASFIMPFYMVRIIETCWYFGETFCKIHLSADGMLYSASMLNLSFISIDRYYAICQPLHYQTKITANTTIIMISVIWTVAFLFGLGFLELNILGSVDFYYENVACIGGCVLFQAEIGSLMTCLLTFFIPGFIIFVMYQKIFDVARQQARSIHSTACNSVHSETSTSKQEKKATKTLAIVIGVFLALGTPFFICNLINPYVDHSIPPMLIESLFCITYLNSTCNPIIYAFYYSWFRKAFKMIIFGQIFQAHSSNAKLSTE